MSRKSQRKFSSPSEGLYGPAFELSASDPQWSWMTRLLERGQDLLHNARHGDLARWHAALVGLPAAATGFSLPGGLPSFGHRIPDQQALIESLNAFHPWRKGPLQVAGVTIDTEWRSDWKWARIEPHINLQGHRVLDIGCGNGYYGWRMLGCGARFVLGLDPTLVYAMQWLACARYAGASANLVLPLGIEDLPAEAGGFDSVFSMGVLYHRRDPVQHLRRLMALCRRGGQAVVETLVLESPGTEVLQPPGRYARMRNVHAVPSVSLLIEWMTQAGFDDIRVVDVSRTGTDEQRSTQWMRFESLDKCLDPEKPELTVEGHPAPVRAALVAKAPD